MVVMRIKVVITSKQVCAGVGLLHRPVQVCAGVGACTDLNRSVHVPPPLHGVWAKEITKRFGTSPIGTF